MEQKPYRILLYYKYVPIENPEEFAAAHLQMCKDIGLKGRIIVAEEGLNGTVSGTIAQTDEYIAQLRKDPRFADMPIKIDEADGHAFKKMFVRHKPELVTWRLEEKVDPNRLTGKHLKPAEWYEMLQRDDVVVLDGRNAYEYDIGHFRGAIRPEVESSREFPEWIRENFSKFKDKKVLTYCTGGIRCEVLSGILLREGFEEVYQLDGGIVTYGKDPEVKGQLFDGKCYVFDERISVPINQVEDVVVGTCYHCGKKEDRYVNCANPECNLQHIVCPECEIEHKRSCSKECEEHPRNRYIEEQKLLEEQKLQQA
ncbi:oxygen-dependent tRNA uridine(34) hydroxylase TrhO [Brevibacillus migulae]|uniref:oxygen-dependent tRNA uridine(34) hydroxylase TrhO n=1 Tax=Brevibacillus migulae TaxID=1644114 RepID=UPI00106E3989|nr:rhodanese-related sulfurtransferase [Brevibacillus migulae]